MSHGMMMIGLYLWSECADTGDMEATEFTSEYLANTEVGRAITKNQGAKMFGRKNETAKILKVIEDLGTAGAGITIDYDKVTATRQADRAATELGR